MYASSSSNCMQSLAVRRRINPRFDHARAAVRQRPREGAFELLLGFRTVGGRAETARQRAPVDRTQGNPGWRVAALPLLDVDQAERGIGKDDDDDAQAFADGGEQLA